MLAVVKRVMSEGFRVFFLAAGFYGVFTGIVWAIWLYAQTGDGGSSGILNVEMPYMWHAHEMIFGYAGAAMGGFFLTAVPNWTNTPAARTVFLTCAALIWLSGRIALWYSGVLPPVAVALVDLAFVPVLAIKIATQLIKRPKPQNMMFLFILLLLWCGNIAVHLEWSGVFDTGADAGLRTGLFALCAMIVVLGGRITPAFTRNAMKREGIEESRWPVSDPRIEKSSLILSIGLPVLVLLQLPEIIAGAVAVVLGVLQAGRLARWRGKWTMKQPILFALHLGIGMLGLGYVLWGLSAFGIGEELAAIHLLGIGGVGGMTLAVMSRAALGHSGRPLVAPVAVTVGYALIAATAMLRWAVGLFAGAGYFELMVIVSLSWAAAFALFVIALWPALTRARVDGAST